LVLSKDSMNAKQLVLSSAKLIRQIYFVQPMQDNSHSGNLDDSPNWRINKYCEWSISF